MDIIDNDLIIFQGISDKNWFVIVLKFLQNHFHLLNLIIFLLFALVFSFLHFINKLTFREGINEFESWTWLMNALIRSLTLVKISECASIS